MTENIVWTPGVTLEQIEKDVILKAFRFFRGNKTTTANALGIAIRTLDHKLEKYEAEGKIHERQTAELRERERIQHERARGIPDIERGGYKVAHQNVQGSANGATPTSAPRTNPNTGNGVESTAVSASQPTLSMQVGTEVQKMPQTSTAESGPRKRGRQVQRADAKA